MCSLFVLLRNSLVVFAVISLACWLVIVSVLAFAVNVFCACVICSCELQINVGPDSEGNIYAMVFSVLPVDDVYFP